MQNGASKVHDFRFLDDQIVLCAVLEPPHTTASLVAIQLPSTPSPRQGFAAFCTGYPMLRLDFPRTVPGAAYYGTRVWCTPRLTPPSRDGLFKLARSNPVILTQLTVSNEDNVVHYFHFLIPCRVVDSRLRQVLKSRTAVAGYTQAFLGSFFLLGILCRPDLLILCCVT